jgi:hypothetical protein
MTDDGAPQLYWTARIENTSGNHNIARADADLEFLAREIRGNKTNGAEQSLVDGKGVDLVGRNEIRIAPKLPCSSTTERFLHFDGSTSPRNLGGWVWNDRQHGSQ